MSFSESSLRLKVPLLALSLFASAIPASAKPRRVNLKEELKSASIITLAKIVSYNSNSLNFKPIGFAGRSIILTAKYSTDPAWNPSRFIYSKWPPTSERTNLTSVWPPVGAEVLVVVDKDNVISLFAWSIEDSYRFWSPVMTGSAAVFNCKPLGVPIDVLSKNRDTGWDGCLVKKSKIAARFSAGTILAF